MSGQAVPRKQDLALMESVGFSLASYDSRYGWTLDHQELAIVLETAREQGRLEEALRIGHLILSAHNGKE
jgi:hypothetical protein